MRFAVTVAALIIAIATCAFAYPLTPRDQVAQPSNAGGATANVTEAVSQAASGFPDNPVPQGYSPTTGLPFTGEYKPLLVQVNNYVESRPQWNLSKADIVYETINAAFGASGLKRYHTRYTAVYSDEHPAFVGPIRSARVHHMSLREEWDAPIVHWGGTDWADSPLNINTYLKNHNVSINDPNDYSINGIDGHDNTGTLNDSNAQLTRATVGEYARTGDNNGVANLDVIVSKFYPTDKIPPNHAFRFVNQIPQVGVDVIGLSIKYGDAYEPEYTYNASTRVFERSYDGKPQIDGYTNERIVASNVIVQRVPTKFIASNSAGVSMELVGVGKADLYIGGKCIVGNWVRASESSRTVFVDDNGAEIPLMPGKTFIQIIPTSLEYTMTRADGTIQNMVMDGVIAETELEEIDPVTEQEALDEAEADI